MGTEQDLLELSAWYDETRDKPLETMAAFFDARISSYEEHMSPWSKHYQRIAENLPMKTKTLLDIGCGSGLELDEIFKKIPKLLVTGIDLSGEMLAALKRKHTDKALTLIQDDYFVHGFGEDCFDAVISVETLHHFTAQRKTDLFKKVLSCLKPGGIYLECDYIAVSQEIEDLAVNELKQRRRRYGIAENVFVHFDTPLTLEHEMKAMKDAGFSTVESLGFLEDDNHTAMIQATK